MDREPPWIYRDPRHYDLLAQMTAPADLPYYLKLIEGRRPLSILELGCGTGRLTLPLAKRGALVTGLDLSAPLLEWARLKAKTENIAVSLLQRDMRAFDLGEKFDVIIIPYNAFNHLYDLSSISRMIQSTKSHIKPDGLFIIDTFNPNPSKLSFSEISKEEKIIEYIDPTKKKKIKLFEQTLYNVATQINTVFHRYEFESETEITRDSYEMRIFFPQELDMIMTLNGFKIVHKFGDYERNPFRSSSPLQLIECQLPAEIDII
jgi:2-polyprenyl-3-methyl-5-hydroxy-6-metoxy-1,4-benzoquinol methylase